MTKTLTIVVASMLVFSVSACGDDSAGGNNNTVNCTDVDGDGYGVGADCLGADCNDADVACWEGACCTADCTDVDGDGYGVGVDCLGPDCDDADVSCWEGACCTTVDCADLDGDGYGNGADCIGPDCNDSDPNCHVGACCGGNCTDADGDTYGVGVDCAGPDCNDADAACWTPGDACCPQPGNGNVGEACTDVSQCTGITDGTAECLTDVFGVINFPGGYCTGSGCTPGNSCDNDTGICVDIMGLLQYCLKPCTDVSQCRGNEGYVCQAAAYQPQPGDPTYCVPPFSGP